MVDRHQYHHEAADDVYRDDSLSGERLGSRHPIPSFSGLSGGSRYPSITVRLCSRANCCTYQGPQPPFPDEPDPFQPQKA
jgi:hypothetical protein